MMVSRQDQITELQRDQSTWHEHQWLGQCDGWIRPWAVRALSGHTVHHDPAKNFMELDPHKFAISPPLSLVNQIGGAFHATSCRNLFSVVERGILLGTSIQDDQYARYDTGRLHSYYGGLALWDSRNTATKQRVSGRGNSGLWNADGRSLHSYCGPHQAARKNYRQGQHHREPSCAFQPREGGLVLRTERK